MNLIPLPHSSGRIAIHTAADARRPIVDVWGPSVSGLPQSETDRLAALFVAAPDLLEALKVLIDHERTRKSAIDSGEMSTFNDALNAARAAIAKAEPQPQNEQQ